MTNISNARTFDEALAEIKGLGAAAGTGSGARTNVLIKAVYYASEGALDTQRHAINGVETNHAKMLYEAYTAAAGQKAAHNDKTVAAKSSNIRKAIELGQRNDIDPNRIMQTAAALYKKMSQVENNEVRSSFEALNAVIRVQLESATEITQAVMEDCILRSPKKDRDEASYLETARKALEKAFDLNKRPEVEEAYNAVAQVLQHLVNAQQAEEDAAKLAEIQARMAARTYVPTRRELAGA